MDKRRFIFVNARLGWSNRPLAWRTTHVDVVNLTPLVDGPLHKHRFATKKTHLHCINTRLLLLTVYMISPLLCVLPCWCRVSTHPRARTRTLTWRHGRLFGGRQWVAADALLGDWWRCSSHSPRGAQNASTGRHSSALDILLPSAPGRNQQAGWGENSRVIRSGRPLAQPQQLSLLLASTSFLWVPWTAGRLGMDGDVVRVCYCLTRM